MTEFQREIKRKKRVIECAEKNGDIQTLSACGIIATAGLHTPRVATRLRPRRRFDAAERLLFAREAGWKKPCK